MKQWMIQRKGFSILKIKFAEKFKIDQRFSYHWLTIYSISKNLKNDQFINTSRYQRLK